MIYNAGFEQTCLEVSRWITNNDIKKSIVDSSDIKKNTLETAKRGSEFLKKAYIP